MIDGASQPAHAIPPAEEEPSRARPARRDFGDIIESRVLAQLEQSIGKGWPLGAPKPPRRRDVSTEVERLRELRADGALTDEQYQRAVDRLLEEGS